MQPAAARHHHPLLVRRDRYPVGENFDGDALDRTQDTEFNETARGVDAEPLLAYRHDIHHVPGFWITNGYNRAGGGSLKYQTPAPW